MAFEIDSAYTENDALGLAGLVKRKQVSPAELLQQATARAGQVNGKLNAIVQRFDLRAQNTIATGVPEGEFSGVPFLVKDLLLELAGTVTTGGSVFFQDYTPAKNSELANRFEKAGLVIFGKTNTPEFGATPITDSELYGSCLNPWNTGRSPGGSSGGSASAVAAGVVPMASGGDGGGSIRIPASCTGLVGLKPSRGRTPTGPNVGDYWFGMAQEHVLSRSVRDSAAALDATAGKDAGAPNFLSNSSGEFLKAAEAGLGKKRLKIGFTTAPMLGRKSHPDCTAAVESAAKLLESMGHELEQADPQLDRENFIFHFNTLVAADVAATISRAEKQFGRKAGKSDIELMNRAIAKLGNTLSAADVAEAYLQMQLVGREMGRYHQRYDIWLSPTMGVPPVEPGGLKATGADLLALHAIDRLPLGAVAKRRDIMVSAAQKTFDYMAYTPIGNASGQPAISLPLHWNSEGLPIGVQLSAALGEDALLLALARDCELAQPWFEKRPPLFAH